MSVEIIRALRKDLQDIQCGLKKLNECLGCRKGPCVARLYKYVGYVHKTSLYMSDGKFYIRKCTPVRKTPCGGNNVRVYRNYDGRLVFQLPEFNIEGQKYQYWDVPAIANLVG